MTTRAATTVLAALLAISSPACATHGHDLDRSRRAFEENAHERALAILRAMEPNMNSLRPTERAQYAYLRGMTDYRIGYRLDARHWLALARAMNEEGALPSDWKGRLDQALKELDAQVWERGHEALSNTQRPSGAAPDEAAGTRRGDEP